METYKSYRKIVAAMVKRSQQTSLNISFVLVHRLKRWLQGFQRWRRRLTWVNWLVFTLFIMLSGGSIYGILFLVNLIDDPELALITSRETLVFLLVLPSILVLISLFILGKILFERIQRQPGTSIRFKIITLFSIALLLPIVIFIFFFNKIFDFTVNQTLENKLLTDNLKNDLERHQIAIAQLQSQHITSFKEFLTTQSSTITLPRGLDIIFFYNAQNTPINITKRYGITLPNTPTFNFKEELPHTATSFSSYEENRGFIYTLYHHLPPKATPVTPPAPTYSAKDPTQPAQSEANKLTLTTEPSPPDPVSKNILPTPASKPTIISPTNIGNIAPPTLTSTFPLLQLETIGVALPPQTEYIAALTFIPSPLKNEINNTLEVIRQFKQFELLIKPFQTLSIVLLLYLHIQIFAISIIIFYYRSNRYLIPIGELIASLRNISDFTHAENEPLEETLKLEARLLSQIRRLQGNEIGELLRAFYDMKRHVRRNRRRLNEILELKGWKEAATQLAHEIKNPLTPILLSVSEVKRKVMRHDLTLYEQLLNSFNLMEIEVKRIANLINEFASFSKESVLTLSRISIKELFQKLELQLKTYSNIAISITRKGPDYIDGDEEKIYRVLINLSQNAIAALEPITDRPRKLSIAGNSVLIEDNLYYEIIVTDNGAGINPELRANIFKPYITSKHSGLGLGLAICKQIAISHEGEIFLKPTSPAAPPSAPQPPTAPASNETSFIFRLPIKTNNKVNQTHANAPENLLPAARAQISSQA